MFFHVLGALRAILGPSPELPENKKKNQKKSKKSKTNQKQIGCVPWRCRGVWGKCDVSPWAPARTWLVAPGGHGPPATGAPDPAQPTAWRPWPRPSSGKPGPAPTLAHSAALLSFRWTPKPGCVSCLSRASPSAARSSGLGPGP